MGRLAYPETKTAGSARGISRRRAAMTDRLETNLPRIRMFANDVEKRERAIFDIYIADNDI